MMRAHRREEQTYQKRCDYCTKPVNDSCFQVIICYVIHWFCSRKCLVMWVKKKEKEG